MILLLRHLRIILGIQDSRPLHDMEVTEIRMRLDAPAIQLDVQRQIAPSE